MLQLKAWKLHSQGIQALNASFVTYATTGLATGYAGYVTGYAALRGLRKQAAVACFSLLEGPTGQKGLQTSFCVHCPHTHPITEIFVL